MDNEEEIPFFMRYAHLVPTAKSLAPESEEDGLSSSSEVVDKEFDKNEFLIRFQASITEAISTAMSEVISKLLKQPAKNVGISNIERIYVTERKSTSLTILEWVAL